jgi:hypothetical protein
MDKAMRARVVEVEEKIYIIECRLLDGHHLVLRGVNNEVT